MSTSRMYIVRIWHEPCTTGEVWRASVTNVRTQEKLYFKSPEELNRFLEEAERQNQQIQKA
ncbi:MAG: hypothetical protein N2318_11540, partial [Meiothermus sp.]|nr:hypothetical protein [Meiothermus sp.]